MSQKKRIANLNRPPLKRQQGVVIVMALLIVALVVTMAYTMMSRLARDTNRTTLIVRDAQAEYFAQGSLIWAMDQLRHNWESKTNERLVDVIPMQSAQSEVNGYKISSVIYDMQARFNVNNLNQTDALTVFQQLIKLVDPKLKVEEANQFTQALTAWLGAGKAQGQYTEYYLHLPVPYRPAYKPMISISELLLVKGMTPSLYRALQPHVTALPQGTQVNVQTASAEVLAALSPTMTMEAARQIVELRKQKPILSTQQFMSMDMVKNHAGFKEGLITVTSKYFLVETTVIIEKQRLVLYTLLLRNPKDNKATVTIVWQSKGTW